jgi:uncharacterized protein YbgA (DUF1722 family)
VSKKQENTRDFVQKLTEKDIKEYVFERFAEVKESNQIKNLVSFQAMNKHLIMAHNQEKLKILGNIIANNKKIKFSETLEEYEKHLKIALDIEPTTKTHSNVILHIFGFFLNNFSQHEKERFFELLSSFKEGKISIGEVLCEIHPMIYRFNNTYLTSQTYFLLYSNPQERYLFKSLQNI